MDKELIYHGVDHLDALGYKGQGVNVLVFENTENSHSHLVAATAQYMAPECNVIRWYSSLESKEIVDYCKANKVDIINISLATRSQYPILIDALRSLIHDGVIVFSAAGNQGEDGHKGLGKEVSIMVGAGSIRADGKAWKDPTSGIDEQMDFIFLTPPARQGTSFAAPMAAGLAARLLNHRRYTQPEIYKLFMDMAEDMAESDWKNWSDQPLEGWDKFSGWGIPRFRPEDMEEEDMARVIEMWIGRQGYLVDGESKVMDVPPVITNGRTLVPIRAVAEAFGAQVDYEPGTQKITITMGD